MNAPARSVLLVADAGGPLRHVGDELLLEVVIEELAAPDRGFTVVSDAPLACLGRPDVTWVAAPGFPATPGSIDDQRREERLAEVLAGSDPVSSRLVESVAAADAVILVGGGNLSATWPTLAWARIALLHLAATRGLPVYVAPQTVGPLLTEAQRVHLGGGLAAATDVCARDRESLELLHELGVAQARLHPDDVFGWDVFVRHHDDRVHRTTLSVPERYAALTLHRTDVDIERDAALGVRLVQSIRRRTDLPVVLVPNTWPNPQADTAVPPPAGRGVHHDLALAERIVAALADPAIARLPDDWHPEQPPTATAAVLAAAQLVVSSRLHPVVLGLSAGVPCLALPDDHYTSIKLRAALQQAGLDGWHAPLHVLRDEANHDVVDTLLDELWRRRIELTDHLRPLAEGWQRAHRARWDAMRARLSGGTLPIGEAPAPPSNGPAPTSTVPRRALDAAIEHGHELLADAGQQSERAERYALSLQAALAESSAAIDRTEQYTRSLQAALEDRIAEIDRAERYTNSLQAALEEKTASLDYGHDLMTAATEQFEQAQQYALSLHAALGEKEEELAGLYQAVKELTHELAAARAAQDAALAETAHLRDSLAAANELAVQLTREHAAASAAHANALSHLHAIITPPTLVARLRRSRWARPLRPPYRVIRATFRRLRGRRVRRVA